MLRKNEFPAVKRLIIRPAFPGEADLLSALALRSKAYWGYSPEFMDACREELSYSPGQIKNPEFAFMVADLAGVLIGFYALKRLSAVDFELEALFVEPVYIGQGVGRALMDHAKWAAGDLGGKMLIIQSDPHAEKFYRAAGGRPAGQRESGSIPGRHVPLLTIRLRPLDHTEKDPGSGYSSGSP